MKVYNRNLNVFEAAKQRISWVFDNYEKIIVCVSGGKDSTVLFDLAHNEAVLRNRFIHVYYLDYEFVNNSTVEIIDSIMRAANVIPLWVQIPLVVSTSVSMTSFKVNAWGVGEIWIREKADIATTFYDIPKQVGKSSSKIKTFLTENESKHQKTATLIGIRADESLDRFRAVTKNPTNGIYWCTKGKKYGIKYYPLYDFNFSDIWTYISRFNIKYNSIYDKMYSNMEGVKNMRVAALVGSRSYMSLNYLQIYEPNVYEKIISRVHGSHTASRYITSNGMYRVNKLPNRYRNWIDYRNYVYGNLDEKLQTHFRQFLINKDNSDLELKNQINKMLIGDTKGVVKMGKNNSEQIITKWNSEL